MANYKTVEEALAEVQGRRNKNGKLLINRFNKKKFNQLMIAMINDPNFTEKVVKPKGDSYEIEEVMVSKGFRKWCKYLIEQAGMDSAESERVLTTDFKIHNVDGLYDFFAAALYEYVAAGSRFDLPGKEDFQAGIELKEVDEQVRVGEAKSPVDGKILGTFETTKGKHRELKIKGGTPKWLTKKKKIK